MAGEYDHHESLSPVRLSRFVTAIHTFHNLQRLTSGARYLFAYKLVARERCGDGALAVTVASGGHHGIFYHLLGTRSAGSTSTSSAVYIADAYVSCPPPESEFRNGEQPLVQITPDQRSILLSCQNTIVIATIADDTPGRQRVLEDKWLGRMSLRLDASGNLANVKQSTSCPSDAPGGCGTIQTSPLLTWLVFTYIPRPEFVQCISLFACRGDRGTIPRDTVTLRLRTSVMGRGYSLKG